MHSPGHCQVQGIASSLRVLRCMSARSVAQLWLPYWLASSQCSLPSLHMFMHGLQSTPLGNKGVNTVQVAASLFGTQQSDETARCRRVHGGLCVSSGCAEDAHASARPQQSEVCRSRRCATEPSQIA